jgi:hypothetical protein
LAGKVARQWEKMAKLKLNLFSPRKFELKLGSSKVSYSKKKQEKKRKKTRRHISSLDVSI